MKTLTNRYGSFLTGDDLADAVLHYGLALARRQQLDLVDIPYRAEDGTVGRVQLTIGWLTETTSTSTPAMNAGDAGELVDVDATLAMYDKAENSGVVRGLPFSEEEADQFDWERDSLRIL
ncbi:hypothetical protein [Agromyces salentinus]|uniref:Uncharacterized protein n=1 Tax=Agromyces salentinus TaxID=269421 RepID=A0ABN2MTG0_9MICO|nr:hypothetical protein [Agromyces salentinus]